MLQVIRLAFVHDLIAIAREASWSFGILLLLLAGGLGPMLLVRELVRFPMLAAPFAGLLLVNTAALAVYFIFVTTFTTALLAAAAIVVTASVVIVAAQRLRVDPGQAAASLALIALTAICFSTLSEPATISNGSPSVTFLDGWDTLSYAHIADWIRNHQSRPEVHAPPGTTRPHANPAVPYESLPELLLGNEARTGAFGFLAAIGTVRGVPSAFAYDPACAVLLASAILGVAAIFAGTWPALAMLVLGLAVSHWYDYTHSGFLAKSLAYPSILFVAGLVLRSRRNGELHILGLLCAFSAASGLLLSGLVTAAALLVLCAFAELMAYRSERRVAWQDLSRLGICSFVAVATCGYLQHPVVGWDRRTFPAAVVASKSLDLEGWTAITGFSDLTLTLMIVAAVACTVVLAGVAFLSRRYGPASLILSPIVLYGLLLILHLRPELMETTGLLYPATMCGTAWLISEVPPPSPRPVPFCLFAAAIAATIGLRIPRALTAVAHYTGETALRASYAKEELDQVAAAIGSRTTLIDIGRAQARECVLMLVELGRRGLALQWTADSWYWPIQTWRSTWSVPTYSRKPELIVVPAASIGTAKPLYLGPHFAVVPNANGGSPSMSESADP